MYASSFGTQWKWFRTTQLDSLSGRTDSAETLHAVTGWTPEHYQGRLLLDAGAGAGRFAEVALNNGAEVVGIDITTAIDAAYANLGREDKVHLLQADIFSLPFRDGTFDLAYSIGVLHHTPDPHTAFNRVAAVVKSGGGLAIYVYSRYGPGHRFSDTIRTITVRLPLGIMRTLSLLAVPFYYLYRLPILGPLFRLVAPISLHPNWRWRWLDTFDWYTPRYQWKFLYPEVFRWFREIGFVNIELSEVPVSMCGTKHASLEAAGSADPQANGRQGAEEMKVTIDAAGVDVRYPEEIVRRQRRAAVYGG